MHQRINNPYRCIIEMNPMTVKQNPLTLVVKGLYCDLREMRLDQG